MRGPPRQIPVEDGGNEADQGTSLFCKGDAPAAEVTNTAIGEFGQSLPFHAKHLFAQARITADLLQIHPHVTHNAVDHVPAQNIVRIRHAAFFDGECPGLDGIAPFMDRGMVLGIAPGQAGNGRRPNPISTVAVSVV